MHGIITSAQPMVDPRSADMIGSMRIRWATALVLVCALAAQATSSDIDFKPSDDALTSLIERAVAAGMPDVRSAEVWQGQWTEDPAADFGGRPGWTRLHLHLRDGRWLMRGLFLRPSGYAAAMFIGPSKRIVDESIGDHIFGIGMNSPDGELDLLVAAGFEPAKQGYARSSEVDVTIPLRECGWTRPAPLLLPGQLRQRDGDSLSQSDERQGTAEELLRRRLHLLLLRMALLTEDVSDRTGIIDASLVILEPSERKIRAAGVERLLHYKHSTGTSVGDRLSRWSDRLARMDIRDASHETDGLPWSPSDVDDLVDCAADTRPSNWIDDQDIPRTVGDNALRALAWLWGTDPRLLIERDGLAPWTDSEREATSSALSSWWRPWRGKALIDAILGDSTRLHLAWTTRLAVAIDQRDRPRLCHAITQYWGGLSADQRDALPVDGVEDILASLGDDPELDRLALSWPVSGPLERTLALWHELRGDPEPLTAHLRSQLLNRTIPGVDRYRYQDEDSLAILHVTMHRNDQQRCDLLLDAYRSPTDSRAWNLAHAVAVAARRGFRYGGETPLLDSRFADFYGDDRLVLLQIYAGLNDERPAPAERTYFRRGLPVPEAADLRICDDVAASRSQDELEGLVTPPFDPNASIQDRDMTLRHLREALRPRVAAALAATGLKATLPDIEAAAFPEWWRLRLAAAQPEGAAIALLITNTQTCPPCRALQQEVLSQPPWEDLSRQLPLIEFDGATMSVEQFESQVPFLSGIYGGSGMPFFIILSRDGRSIDTRIPYEPGHPNEFLEACRQRISKISVEAQESSPARPPR
ncbi:MAG: hypothetical protein H0V44_14490 [Planctomycetes bacterium]|nr:hypothetical protein [Planctomycetota bacterium]